MTPLYVLIIASAIVGCFAAALFSYLVLIAWSSARRIRQGEFFRRRPTAVRAFEIPTSKGLVMRSDPLATGAIGTSLLILVPLLVLAIWSAFVEGFSGLGLVFVIVHTFFLWQLVRLGMYVQRSVGVTRNALTIRPVVGRTREIPWADVRRVVDVTYSGPAVSGLYLYLARGDHVVLDRCLPNWDSLRMTVRALTPNASWTSERRTALGGPNQARAS